MRRALVLLIAAAVATPLLAAAHAPTFTTPIRHIVYILQENHSFDNVLGAWCVQTGRCDGATTGTLPGGGTIQLAPATDLVPSIDHSVSSQLKAIDGGRMDGFAKLRGCAASLGYPCLTQFAPSQMPNLSGMLPGAAISDRTFQDDSVPSWGQHLEAVAATLDGFAGAIPNGHVVLGRGWGCDSGLDTPWTGSGGVVTMVPACVPKPDGSGPYRPSPVSYVPTIMDRLDSVGLSWKLYTGPNTGKGNTSGWGWAICPTFAECLDAPQAANRVDNGRVLTDAAAGTLPAFSVVTPNQQQSQHNFDSMAVGDNWIGQVVSAIENGPDWASTAIFLSWDDCGCFYDHVPPPRRLGIRVPMVIISPFARAGFDDSTTASYASVLAFTEQAYGLTRLTSMDATAYAYSNAFNYAQTARPARFHAVTTRVPPDELRFIAAHPPDANDPT